MSAAEAVGEFLVFPKAGTSWADTRGASLLPPAENGFFGAAGFVSCVAAGRLSADDCQSSLAPGGGFGPGLLLIVVYTA